MTIHISNNAQLFQHPLVLFDGICNLCDHTVRFIIKRDRNEVFRFIPLQSALGKALLDQFGFPPDYRDSFVLIDHGRPYIKSTAFIRISKKLQMPWPLFSLTAMIPRILRDYIYNKIGKNRYSWFGQHDYCEVQPAAMSQRFLTELPQEQADLR
jgi:predicted DCC family thiol-disulfide oxidoreductase YuxK